MHIRNRLSILAAMALLSLSSARAEAATFTVTNLDDSDTGSLRQAILDANALPGADTIRFRSGLGGTILLSAASGKMEVTDNVEIQGPGVGALTVSGGNAVPIFRVAPGKALALNGLQLREGQSTGEFSQPAGGISNFGNLTLTDCLIADNRGDVGGILNRGTLRATDCVFSGNQGQTFGGGMVSVGTLLLTGCTFSGNTAGFGGGIFFGGTATLLGCVFSGNRAVQEGGAVFASNTGATLTANRCTFSENSAALEGGAVGNIGISLVMDCTFRDNRTLTDDRTDAGGAIFNQGRLTVTGSTFSGNNAAGGGGGICNGFLSFGAPLATVERCTFSVNAAHLGGAIQNAHPAGRVTVSDTLFSGNLASRSGAALHNAAGEMELADCTLDNNRAAEAGGGVCNAAGALSLTGCTVSNNRARDGAGLQHLGGSAALSRCRLAGNSAEWNGGGLSGAAGLTAGECTIFANFAGNLGGGLYLEGGAATLQNSTIAGNGAAVFGGGLASRADLTVTGCTVNGNIANEGGGIYNQGGLPIDDGDPAPVVGILTVSNSTLSGNRAFAGGGILNHGNVLMTSCTLFRNRADAGGAIRNFGGGRMKVGLTLLADSGAGLNCLSDGGAVTSFGHNLDSDGSCGFAAAGDLSGTPDAPLDPKLGPLQSNGGPTWTHALAPGSPAIDAGDPALTPGATDPTDQRGFPRIVDGDGDGAAVIDIGAYELGFYGIGDFGGPPREAFLAYSTVQEQETSLPEGTDAFNLTIHYSAEIAPGTFTAKLNGQDLTQLFHPATPDGFETVQIPLQAGQNRLILKVKGVRNGHPATDVDNLGFRVGEPPYGPR